MLYQHQLKIINEDPKRTGLFLGTGSGKTRIALSLAHGKTLVICPKTQKEDRNWERESITIDPTHTLLSNITVISKETFRRDWDKLPRFDTVIVDEAHTCLGVTPNVRQRKKVIIPRASQIYEALEEYIEKNKPERIYLCTATIMKSPMTVWAAMRILGHFDYNFWNFRRDFYNKLPMPGREVYVPKTDEKTKSKLADLVKRIGHVGRLEDYFDVPAQTFKTITVPLTDKQKKRIKEMALEYPDPIARITKVHQIENGVLKGDEFSDSESFDNEKLDKLLEMAIEFPKMIVFARYTAQIEQIQKTFNDKNYNVGVMTGDTKDRGDVIKRMNGLKEGIFIVQAQISAGWQLPSYPVMVFASRTYSFVDYDQALGRIQRADNIKKNLYINLVAEGSVDKAVDKCISQKKDFNEKLYINIC